MERHHQNDWLILLLQTKGCRRTRETSWSDWESNQRTRLPTIFPKASPTLQKVGAVIAAFDPNFTKWLAKINSAGYTPALIVDGAYGPKTTAGVEWVQQKLGITVDGCR